MRMRRRKKKNSERRRMSVGDGIEGGKGDEGGGRKIR